MKKTKYIQKPEKKTLLLETSLKYLKNELYLTKKEADEATRNYFEIYSHMEGKVKERTVELEKANEQLKQEIKERNQAEEDLQKRTYDLDARIKELNCLYGISPLMNNPDISLKETLQRTVDLIPPSWQYPEITCARITRDKQEYRTKNFRETIWKQKSDIIVYGECIGKLEVYYLEEMPVLDEGPFLKEERALIDAIAEQAGRIVEQNQSEEALREIEEKYRSMMETLDACVYICSPDYRLEYLNPAMIRRIGRDATGETCYRAIHGLSRKCPWCVHENVQKGQNCSIEIVSTMDDRCYHASNSPIYHADGTISKMTIYTDITEMKISEEDRIRLSTAIEQSEETVMITSTDGTIEYANQALQILTGYSQDELVGESLFSFDKNPDNQKQQEEAWELLKKGKSWSGQIMQGNKDGSICDMKITISPVIDHDGNISGFVSIGRDITKELMLEEQLQRAQKMETIGTLAGGVAHDLNNILGAIVGYPELLLDEIPEDSPMRSSILAIQKSGQRAAAIVQDLLTLARRGVNVTEVVNLNTMVSEYLKSSEYKKLINFHPAVVINTNLETDLLNTIGSPVHLSKVVMNLVSNAAEALPEGGKVLISTENKYLDKPIKGYDSIKEGDYIVLTVSDDGIGISERDHEKIFEPFYTKKVMGRSGTGLGMTVVWGSVKDHKGYIDVISKAGEGTTFKLYFPVTGKEIQKTEGSVSIEEYIGNGEKILVIDDVGSQRDIAASLLKKLKYNVKALSSGEEAVEHMKNNSADLLILDMIMDPGIDGFETFKRILEIHPRQKAIIASGFSETDRVKDAQRLGVGAYVKKPYTMEKIGLAVKAELQKQS